MLKIVKRIIFIIIVILTILVGKIYLNYENTHLEVSNFNVDVSFLDKFDGFRVAHISDFHNESDEYLVNNLVNKIKEAKPNIIVITGDFIDSKRTNIDVSINFIKKINDIAPIYYVSGNHENLIDKKSNKKLEDKLIENKVNIINNKVENIIIDNQKINIIGVNDPLSIDDIKDNDSDYVKSVLNDINYDKSLYTILLIHRPELFDTYVSENINLVFTGHAHGGQFRFPFSNGLIAPHQGFFPKYTSGMFTQNNTSMIVSRGIGNSVIPYRIANKPELVIVKLNK